MKRRGPLPGLSGIPEATETDVVDDKVQVTLTLDQDVTAFFEAQSQWSGATRCRVPWPFTHRNFVPAPLLTTSRSPYLGRG